MFQYKKLMGLIEKDRTQFDMATDPKYRSMLQEDFQNLKTRKTELGNKLCL